MAESIDPALMRIDGSILEGGGQILRNCVALSVLMKKPVHISSIRAGRDKPGLKAQHLTGIQLVANMFNATVKGLAPKSCELMFTSQSFDTTRDEFVADIGTAGAVSLLLQISLPTLIFAPKPTKLILKGGTNAIMAPQIDFLEHVFKPVVDRMGIDVSINIVRRGFFPMGGGEVHIDVRPIAAGATLKPLHMTDQGTLTSVDITTFTAGKIPAHVPGKANKAAKIEFKRSVLPDLMASARIELAELVVPPSMASGNATGTLIVAKTSTGCVLGGSALGEVRKKAETMGEEAAVELAASLSHGACVDEWVQDQVIIFMALAKGTSSVKIGPQTLHTKTAIHFCELMTGAKFTVTKLDSVDGKRESSIVSCEGIGYEGTALADATLSAGVDDAAGLAGVGRKRPASEMGEGGGEASSM